MAARSIGMRRTCGNDEFDSVHTHTHTHTITNTYTQTHYTESGAANGPVPYASFS